MSVEELKVIFDELSASLLGKITHECNSQSIQQTNQIKLLISDWTHNIGSKTQEIIRETLATTPEGENLATAITESNDRRSKIIQV